MATHFHLLGAAHFLILGTVVLLAVVLAVVERRLVRGGKWLRIALGAVMLADAGLWYGYLAWRGQRIFPSQLPLELCDVTFYLVAFALLTFSPAVFDLAYYFALAGTSMALLTPDLWEQFPSIATVQFFVEHGLAVAATLYLVWSGRMRPRPGSVWRAMLALNCIAALDGTFDAIFKTNYMYLRAKPLELSLLNVLGPWPWYIVSTEVVALGLFALLYLPFGRGGGVRAADARGRG
jgi:hypothetical integral membrane protein (TIGR02206 family)